MSTTKVKESELFKAGKSKGTRVIVHRKFKSDAFVARMDGTSDDYISESVLINDVISAARTYMQDNNIYNLTIHEPNGKIRWIEESQIKRFSTTLSKRRSSRVEKGQKIILSSKARKRSAIAIKPLYKRVIIRDEIIN